MALIGSQLTTALSDTRQRMTAMGDLFAYKGCPRDLSRHNLHTLNLRLVSSLELFDTHPELGALLPSIQAVQEALQDTIHYVNIASDSFGYPSFIEQREYFYKAYRKILRAISRIQASLDVPGAPVAENRLPASAAQWQPDVVLEQLSKRLAGLWKLFRYEYYNLSNLPQRRFLEIEKELRQALAQLATSQDLQERLCSADRLQDSVRETVLQLNFAADLLEIPASPRRSKWLNLVHTTIVECFQRATNDLCGRAAGENPP